jgi:predicted acylesterase/phospholipase RssA
MLREYRVADKGELHRRWFGDRDYDLIVWYDEAGEICAVQLCYDKQAGEHALTWTREKGFAHNRIDDGEITGGHKRTPLLVPDGIFDAERVAENFREAAGELEPELAEFVYEQICSYTY